ncbi:MAG: 4a-hydroxytetrahydrobiopterin dehydratase [Myxococcota bacterium]
MAAEKLSDQAVQEKLSGLQGWALREGKLYRELQFKDFNEAWGFMNRVALYAEQLDHHPEWFNVYRTVRIELATHDAGGITDLDFTLAEKIDALQPA